MTQDPAAGAGGPEAGTGSDGTGKVGRYELLYQIARGGMATVYLARAAGFGGFEKLCALKCIHPHLASEKDYVEMFLDEAKIASRINHPNVCTVFDLGEADQIYFIAMEYLNGETLAHVLKRARTPDNAPPVERLALYAARIVADACEGLHSAHELRSDRGEGLNVVHRDITPHNLFITYDGAVKIVDFGIARAADRVHNTSAGTVKGKFAYMSPEQLRGKEIDRRADIWSLGVTFWELLTGQRLFKGQKHFEVFDQVSKGEIPVPSTVRPGLPEELDDIVLRALARDPEARYPTARALERDLARFLALQSEPMGSVELGEWMTQLFPQERERKRELLEAARTAKPGLSGPPDRLPPAESGSISVPPPKEDGPSDAPTHVLDPLGPMDTVSQAMPEPVRTAAQTAETRPDGRRVTTEEFPLEVPTVLGAPRFDEQEFADEKTTLDVPPQAVLDLGARAAAPAVELFEPIPAGEPIGPAAEAEPRAKVPVLMLVVASLLGVAAAIAVAWAITDGEEGISLSVGLWPKAGGVAAGAPPGATTSPSPSTSPTTSTTTTTSTSTSTTTSAIAGAGAKRGRTRRAEPGIVNVVTPGGWADVYLRGSKVGRSPGRIELPAGRHTLTFRPFGDGRAIQKTVRVGAGEVERVSVPVRR